MLIKHQLKNAIFLLTLLKHYSKEYGHFLAMEITMTNYLLHYNILQVNLSIGGQVMITNSQGHNNRLIIKFF